MEAYAILVLVLLPVLAASQQPEFALPGLPLSVDPSLQVAGSVVFVAAGSRLVRLDGELAQTDAVTLASDVLNIAASPDGQRLVACLSDSSCAVYNASDLNAAPLDVASGVHEATDRGVTVFTVTNESYYVGSIRVNAMGVQSNIVLGKLGGGSNQTREYEITTALFVRNFTSGFLRGSNAYYVVYDTNPVTRRSIRVMRVCDDSGFNALYEAALFCGASVGLNSIVNEVSVVENFLGSSGTTILLSHSRGNSNFVCSFGLSTIDAAMDGRYTDCIRPGSSDDIEPAWDTNDNLNCGMFTNNGVCNFSPPLDDAENPATIGDSENTLINTGTDILTASVGVIVESFSFVFTGFMREGEAFVGAFDVRGATAFLTPSAAFDSIPMPSQVRQLRWEPGLEFVYAITDTTVTRVPIADCAARSNCSSCLAYDNPLCGWCVVENKCSQRAECQNSDTRWKQSTDLTAQCITFNITPNNFILETPEILTVNVTPIVPMLLPNETYSCHLADAQMRFPPIIVPAVAVSQGTQYTCNITGEVASFGGSQAEIAFSFVSSLFGVPFDTNADALTIFDCPAATSCSECLQTRDACGWCNFNKVCSGTADPCVNASSYLMLDGAASFAEVCPLLRPAPQTGGNYNQPVGTATDLTLTTSNLPPPFGDFSYGCRINNVNLPAMYSNESTITCVIDMDNLPLTSPNGQEDVEVTIRWMGPNQLNHPIGAFDPATRVVLYDCPALGVTCSTCLSAIMQLGFECGWCMDTTSCLFVGVTCSSTHVLDGSGCQAPIIERFSPVSGPTEGGTTITIEGVDLGVTFQDFAAAGSISIGMPAVPCTPIAESYQLGSLVQCETTSGVMTGLIHVDLGAPRIGSSMQQFAVVAPAITAVEPAFGPMAGGSRVRVQGSNLDAGNQNDTRVTFNAVNPLDCDITSISDSEINCTTSVFNGSVPSDEIVFVSIDNADVSTVGVVFIYRSNPTFTSLLTANTIPAGGITLSFTGENFDVISNPMIQITDPRYADSEPGECVAVSSMLLNCTAPALLNGPDEAENLTYTVIVDNAPGPMNIPLALLPNPSNFVLATPEHAIGTEAIISITGDGLDNVDISEYRVTVAGQPCVIQSLIFCRSPANPLPGPGLAEVVVFVGDSIEITLADQLEYTEAQAVPLQIIIPCVVGGLVLVVLLSLCLICCIACCYRSKLRTLQKETVDSIKEPIVLTSVKTDTGSEKDAVMEQLMKLIPESLIIPSNQLRLLKSIGQGEFGVVYKAHYSKWHGQGYPSITAVKTLKGLFTMKDVESLVMEILKMKEFDHPHVMTLLGVCLDAGAGVSVVMPFMGNGSLLDYLKRERETLDLPADTSHEKIIEVRKLLLKFCFHIAKGMEYLAAQMFVHRDLAARNCMIDAQGNIKVADFGLSEDIYTSGYFRQGADSTVRLPIKWMAMESLRDGIFTEKSDVWSYGVTTWEVFSVGRLPYPGVDPVNLLKLLEDSHRLAKPSNTACSDNIYSLMCECWYLAEARPTFSELVATLDRHLQAVAGYMELHMVLCDQGAEPVVEGNQAYGLGEPVVEGNQAYGLGPVGAVASGNQQPGE